MGGDKIRHLLIKDAADGGNLYFWNPSKTLRALGLVPEALGKDRARAETRAMELNQLADMTRRGKRHGGNGPAPGSFAALSLAFQVSDEFGDLKPRTRKDYTYYLKKIEDEFGHLPVSALTPKVIKTYYVRVRKEQSVTWAYHILGTLRAVLSWAVAEEWVPQNHAHSVKMKSPKKRKVVWEPEQAERYIAAAREMKWLSVAAMALVFDSIGQSPVDVRTLVRGSYDGRCIDITRTKTGVEGAPIPLFPAAKVALDEYLASQPAKLPEAPMFTNDKIGGEWNESTLQKTHRKIREAAKLPAYLQLQDFRTTVQTEGGAAGGTVDELRGLARHSTRSAGEHYVHPDSRYVESIQEKRLAHRTRKSTKVRTSETEKSELPSDPIAQQDRAAVS